MKLYTRSGDDGSTGLFGGGRVAKDAPRVEAFGQVDQLNSVIGWARVVCTFDPIAAVLDAVQPRLFDLGADLCTPLDSPHAEKVARIGPTHIAELETAIDASCDPLLPMSCFILPGGSELAARLHVARAVCRRTERAVVALARVERIGDHAIVYLNRLSDLLFALARRANQLAGVADVPWNPRA